MKKSPDVGTKSMVEIGESEVKAGFVWDVRNQAQLARYYVYGLAEKEGFMCDRT